MSQPTRSKILTERGFVPLSEASAGMKVFDSTGTLHALAQITGGRSEEIFTIHTSDGFKAEVGASHDVPVSGPRGGNSRTIKAADLSDALTDSMYLSSIDKQPDFGEKGLEVDTMFNPTMLGFMLQEKNPCKGQVSFAPQYTFSVTKHLKPYPDYALSVPGQYTRFRFVYDQATLASDISYQTLLHANLFEGNPDQFRIPSKYMKADRFVRECIVRTFLTDPQSHLHEAKVPTRELASLPYDHPGYGKDLRLLVASLGWNPTPDSRRIVKVESTGQTSPVVKAQINSYKNNYISDGYLVV